MHPSSARIWPYVVERLALRAVAPRRAARKLRPPGADNDSSRPLCAGGVVAARPLPPPNGHAIAVSGCARGSKPGRDALRRVQADRQVGPTQFMGSPDLQFWTRIETMNRSSRRKEALISFVQKV